MSRNVYASSIAFIFDIGKNITLGDGDLCTESD